MGNIALDGEPTAVAVLGQTVFVGINTSESLPIRRAHHRPLTWRRARKLAALRPGRPTRQHVPWRLTARSSSIAIENERDEDLGEGRVPQMPAGNVAIVPLDASTA